MPEIKNFPRINRFKEASALRERFAELGLEMPVDDQVLTAEQGSPLAQPIDVMGKTLSNRWVIHPMEGWDGTEDGFPSEYTLRRWRRFGESGAKLIFGGEAIAVRHDGRANPNQVMGTPKHAEGIKQLRDTLVAAHEATTGTSEDLLTGLQLTHSGRFCRPDPDHQLKPRILYHHPLLDERFGIDPGDDSVILRDEEIYEIIDCYVATAKIAQQAGFDFVDLKHCHGYLGHEFLSAYRRPGEFGGSFENRTRFLRTLTERIRREVPGLQIAVRLSLFDLVPFQDDPGTRKGNQKGVGVPMDHGHLIPYHYAFGVDVNDPLDYDLSEPFRFMELLHDLDISLVNLTCGSPYYNPHIQRPALFPPSDGYKPPEDPVEGVARQIHAVRKVKQRFPNLTLIGTGYTYLQDYLPQVAQAVVRQGWTDLVGIGRMVLSYPRLPLDSLQSGTLDRAHICRTFSDCTTGPRHGMISGCFPLDEYYKELPEADRIKAVKQGK